MCLQQNKRKDWAAFLPLHPHLGLKIIKKVFRCCPVFPLPGSTFRLSRWYHLLLGLGETSILQQLKRAQVSAAMDINQTWSLLSGSLADPSLHTSPWLESERLLKNQTGCIRTSHFNAVSMTLWPKTYYKPVTHSEEKSSNMALTWLDDKVRECFDSNYTGKTNSQYNKAALLVCPKELAWLCW